MEELKKINELINYQARVLVGILLKRLELLSKEEQFDAELYRTLVKELVYENSRNLKTLIELELKIGKVVFKTREN